MTIFTDLFAAMREAVRVFRQRRRLRAYRRSDFDHLPF